MSTDASLIANHWSLFSRDEIDTSTVEYEWTEYKELNTSSVVGLTKYEIETRDKDAFILPHEGYLEVRYKIVKADGVTAIPAHERVALQNNALSLFKNCELMIEDQRIEYCDEPAMGHTVKNLSEFSKQHGESIASNQHFYFDNYDKQDFSDCNLRFYNNTAPRVGVELFFIQNASNQWVPTVASSITTWQGNDVVVARIGNTSVISGALANSLEVTFTTSAPATFGTKAEETLSLSTAAGLLTLSAGVTGHYVEAFIKNTGEPINFRTNGVHTRLFITTTTFVPAPGGAAGNLLTGNVIPIVGNDYYDNGTQKRSELVKGSKIASCWIPLKNMFLFYRGFDKVSRGLRHRIVLNKQSDSQSILRFGDSEVTATAGRAVSITYISMWIPRLKPDLNTLKMLENKLSSNDSFDVNFTDLTVYKSSTVLNRGSNAAIQLSTTTKKPIRVWVGLQKTARVNDSQSINKRQFDFMGMQAIQCRLNGKIYPMYEYKFNSADDKNEGFNRAYNAFLNAGHKMKHFDDGSLIDFEKFKSIYPIYYFDLTDQPEDLYTTQKLAELEIRWSNGEDGYYMYVVYESERLVRMKGVSGNLSLIL
jgi:hypothetical protein